MNRNPAVSPSPVFEKIEQIESKLSSLESRLSPIRIAMPDNKLNTVAIGTPLETKLNDISERLSSLLESISL